MQKKTLNAMLPLLRERFKYYNSSRFSISVDEMSDGCWRLNLSSAADYFFILGADLEFLVGLKNAYSVSISFSFLCGEFTFYFH